MKKILFAVTLAAALPVMAEEAAPTPAPQYNNPSDPWEGFNRKMYAVHDAIDSVVLKPVAKGYETAMPLPARMGVHNFFSNLWEPARAGNGMLQGKPKSGFTSLGRFLINSTLGIFGLFDVASELDIDQQEADLGQTLATWGVPSGPYLFVPLFGPTTLRDFPSNLVEQQYAYPLSPHYVDHVPTRNSVIAARVVDLRAGLLPTDKLLEQAALDPYAYIRSAWLQHRASVTGEAFPSAHDDNGSHADDDAVDDAAAQQP
ncbi:MAG: VacJ family lipoprotein [Zoogloeaceae bacterium]|jgi:phospholipid-binding lipoprotein MlaA|nr:VacJ family lipoprotein [Zoogloeaceae bacterium]